MDTKGLSLWWREGSEITCGVRRSDFVREPGAVRVTSMGQWLRGLRLGFPRSARWLIGASRRTDVKAARSYQPVMVVLLDDVGAPASDPGAGEDGRVQLRRDAQQMKHRGRIEVHIAAEVFFPLHHSFQLFTDAHPTFLAELLAEPTGELAHDRDARAALFVNAVAETHDFFFARQPLQHPGLGAVRGANVPQQPHGFLGR